MNKYLPTLQHISTETIATGLALIICGLIIASNPKLRALVHDYQLPTTN